MKKSWFVVMVFICTLLCGCGDLHEKQNMETSGDGGTEYLAENSKDDSIEDSVSREENDSEWWESYYNDWHSPHNPYDYNINQMESYSGNQMFDRSLPKKIILEDNREMFFVYDDNACLTDISMGEEVLYHFEWQLDAFTGRRTIKTMKYKGFDIQFRDKWVTLDALRGETKYIPSFYQIDDSNRLYYYHLSPGSDYRIDGIHSEGKELLQISYEENCPIVKLTEDGMKLEDEEKQKLLANCRFLDGAIYIQELGAYYYPDRFLVDAKSGKVVGDILKDYDEDCYQPVEEKQRIVEGDLTWNADTVTTSVLLGKALPDGRKLEFLYGYNPWNINHRILIQKNVDGQCVSQYKWIYNDAGRDRIDQIITNGVTVTYLYDVVYGYNSLRYSNYGFRYQDKVYQCYYYANEGMSYSGDAYMSIYCDGEEIVCYDKYGKVMRGTPLPEEIDPLVIRGSIDMKEMGARYGSGDGFFYWNGENEELIRK